MPSRERLIRIVSDARTGARINRFHEQVDAVAVEATLERDRARLTFSLSFRHVASPSRLSLVSMELSTRLLAKSRQLELYQEKNRSL